MVIDYLCVVSICCNIFVCSIAGTIVSTTAVGLGLLRIFM